MKLGKLRVVKVSIGQSEFWEIRSDGSDIVLNDNMFTGKMDEQKAFMDEVVKRCNEVEHFH